MQGCGKSLAAKSLAAEWGYELARLDAGALYDKFVGESEKKLRKALELAQKLAPMVLWIDEIEKAFASAGTSGDADAGLSQRLLATLLTWMQDRESGVFLAATSNNINALPPEMLRKGRFDEIFFVDLPSSEVRAALFAMHLKKRGWDAAPFDLLGVGSGKRTSSAVLKSSSPLSRRCISAFAEKQQLTTGILLVEIRSTQPLSVTRAEDIQAIRQWGRKRQRCPRIEIRNRIRRGPLNYNLVSHRGCTSPGPQTSRILRSMVLITVSILPLSTCLARLRVKPFAVWNGT